MLLGSRGSRIRCLVVWTSPPPVSRSSPSWPAPRWPQADVTAAALRSRTPLDRALTEVAAFALLGCALWMWAATTAVVLEARRGGSVPDGRCRCGPRRGTPAGAGGLRRRPRRGPRPAVVATGSQVGHVAAPGTAHRCPGSRSPTGPRPRPRPDGQPDAGPSRVPPGDTLWSIAVATSRPAPRRPDHRRWHAIYAANRPLIGPDPDVIEPGQRLRLPGKDRVMTLPIRPLRRVRTAATVVSLARSRPGRHCAGHARARPAAPPATYPRARRRSTAPPGRLRPPRRGPVDLVRRRRFEQHAARIGAAVVEIVGGDRPVASCCAGPRPRSTRTSPGGPTWSPGRRRAPPGSGGIQSVRPQLVALHTSFVVRALRRGQPARALRRPLPRRSRPLRADPRALAGVGARVCLSSGPRGASVRDAGGRSSEPARTEERGARPRADDRIPAVREVTRVSTPTRELDEQVSTPLDRPRRLSR